MGSTAFEVIVKQQIKRLEEPSIKCCQLVYDELIRILGQLLAKVVSDLTSLLFNIIGYNFFCSKLSDGIQPFENALMLSWSTSSSKR